MTDCLSDSKNPPISAGFLFKARSGESLIFLDFFLLTCCFSKKTLKVVRDQTSGYRGCTRKESSTCGFEQTLKSRPVKNLTKHLSREVPETTNNNC